MAETQSWDYGRHYPPQLWHLMEKSQAGGSRQSPIEIDSSKTTAGAPRFPTEDYHPVPIEKFHFTHQHLEISVPEAAGRIKVGNDSFQLKNLHLHTPAEHVLDGSKLPMEIHIVHSNECGTENVVVGMWVAEGPKNQALDSLIAVLNNRVDHEPEREKMWMLEALKTHSFTPASLFPADKTYYYYEGSLTTPPCSENVRFFLFKTPITASAGQIVEFRRYAPQGNDRPLQPLNCRTVWCG